MSIVFKIADDKGLLLTDLKDLRAMLNYVAEHRKDFAISYGSMTTQSIGGIVRALLPLENQGGEMFFGQPSLDILDWIRTAEDGRGMVNILHSVQLVQNPKLYASFLLWMMSELFERLPEAGDMDKPKLVFFFDEAHMLFSDAPKVLVQKIEQVVKLIRSKGVGIYFVTQSPGDIPDPVLAQLSNRVQHALRAYTPAEQKAVRVAAQSFRENPAFKTEDVIMELGVGHALTSFLDEEGVPTIAQQTAIICPQSLMAPVDEAVRTELMAADGMDKYDVAVDLDSAYEMLVEEAAEDAEEAKLAAEQEAKEKAAAEEAKLQAKAEADAAKQREKEALAEQRRKEREALEAQKEKEAKEKKRQKEIERRKTQIERALINTGMQILKRGLMNTLFK